MHQHLGGSCDCEINSHHGKHNLLTKYKANVMTFPLTSVQIFPFPLPKSKEKPEDAKLEVPCLTGWWLIVASALQPVIDKAHHLHALIWSRSIRTFPSFWISTRAAHPAGKIAKLVRKVLVHTAAATVWVSRHPTAYHMRFECRRWRCCCWTLKCVDIAR